jgi:outer membrane protein W
MKNHKGRARRLLGVARHDRSKTIWNVKGVEFVKCFNIAGAVLCVAVLMGVSAEGQAADADTVVALGYSRGGDQLIRVAFKDGTTHSLSANQGAALDVGAIFYLTKDLTWQTQATVGVQYNTILAKNGSAEWTTYPIHVIEFYNADLIRIGAGLAYQVNPHVRTSGAVASYSVNLNNALGWVAQFGFRAKKRQGLSVDVRYTSITYSGDAIYAGVPQRLANVHGGSIGVYLTAMF